MDRPISPSLAPGSPDPSGQLSLFSNRCSTCPLPSVCGEYLSSTACRDPAEYRPGAAHPDTVRLVTGQLLAYTNPPKPARWHGALKLPAVVAVAAEGKLPIPSYCAINARRALNARAPAPSPIACLITSDALLSRIWRKRSTLGKTLRQSGYKLAIAPGFSTWWTDPPFEGLHEIARTMETATRLARHIDTIPTIVWRNHADVDRWATWLLDPTPAAVAIDLGTARSKETWRWALDGVAFLSEIVTQRQVQPRLITMGPSTLSRIQQLREVWPHPLTIFSKSAWQWAAAGLVIEESGRRAKAYDADFDEILAQNIAALEAVAA